MPLQLDQYPVVAMFFYAGFYLGLALSKLDHPIDPPSAHAVEVEQEVSL